MKKALIVSFIVGLFGCAEQHTQAPEVVGTWEPTLILLESADIPESDPRFEIFVATTSNWERVMGIKPIRTTYFADGTFRREHRNIKDSIFVISKGTWYTVGDSLYFFQWEPDTFSHTYQFSVLADTLTFRGIVDWERDGSTNDKFYGKQVRLHEAGSDTLR